MERSSADAAVLGLQDNLDEVYPPGAPLTFWRLNAERQALRQRLQYLDALKATCRTCRHFAGAKGFNRCAHFDDVPPDDFMATEGQCESWVSDGVPF